MFEALKCLFPWDLLGMLLGTALLTWWLTRNAFKGTIDKLQERIEFLEGELDTCRSSKSSVSVRTPSIKVEAPAANLDLNVGSGIAASSLAGVVANATSSTKKDDLKIVEGIGPKIEELFHNAGIFSFAQLAETSEDTMKSILDAAGSRFQMHDPSTWAAQSALARDGKWDELKQWQDELNKGKKA